MVIGDFDIMSIGIFPSETDAPLVINADAMLPFPVSIECLKMIAWREPEEVDVGSGVDELELYESAPGDVGWDAVTSTIPKRLGVLLRKPLDHAMENGMRPNYLSNGFYLFIG